MIFTNLISKVMRTLNVAGWQPITFAITSNPDVYVERFGGWPNLYFTFRTVASATAETSVTIFSRDLNIPSSSKLKAYSLLGGPEYDVSDDNNGYREITDVTITPTQVLVYSISPSKVYL